MKIQKASFKKLASYSLIVVGLTLVIGTIFLQSNLGKELTIKGRQYVQLNLHQNWGVKLALLECADFLLTLLPQQQILPFDRDKSDAGFDRAKIIDSHSIKAISLVAPKLYQVSSEVGLRKAMLSAHAGDVILLAPGNYFVPKRLEVRHNGTLDRPIRIVASSPGNSVLHIQNTEGIYLDKANWHIENIVFKGACKQQRYCEHAIHLYGNADNTQIINNQFIDFNAAVKANGNYQHKPAWFADNVTITNNDFFNHSYRNTMTPATPIDVVGGNNWLIDKNFIADFARTLTGKISVTYGGFLKGGGANGVFSNNVINCAWRLPYQSSLDVRVGLSFGNGGTQGEFCQSQHCEYEHTGGKIKDNLVLNCINDVSIYLNKAAASEITGNRLLNSLGIDARFKQTSVNINHNIVDGRIKARDNAFISQRDNDMVN
ncbi:right-handed parallel beta-helix repeat-containing protein [Aliiglaciecola lipolytica]|uniref:Right handed beta helix domain-containing protein n=1 Tax=Aliiglaciecola lipolytica E3 TaxID=1127673 RepID=K6YNG7_9ALTE|nr:hypothetical protein [Aliiglaciecola lipolytica]GAC12865.1 hypothetical protein GLIP_0211 [Aliiglaciecola lipolytica E3]